MESHPNECSRCSASYSVPIWKDTEILWWCALPTGVCDRGNVRGIMRAISRAASAASLALAALHFTNPVTAGAQPSCAPASRAFAGSPTPSTVLDKQVTLHAGATSLREALDRIANAARIAIITMTTNNSTSVAPVSGCDLDVPTNKSLPSQQTLRMDQISPMWEASFISISDP